MEFQTNKSARFEGFEGNAITRRNCNFNEESGSARGFANVNSNL